MPDMTTRKCAITKPDYPVCERCQGHQTIAMHKCGYRVLCPKCRGTGWQPRLANMDPRPFVKGWKPS